MEIRTKILSIDDPSENKFLRKKTTAFDFKKYGRKEIDLLVRKMREAMHRANGMGLAANQIGLDASVFVAKVENKFYAIFNPSITKSSNEMIAENGEGCLSVPKRYGGPRRNAKIMLQGFDKNGKNIKIKAWGTLAVAFQHEVDHLNGILFIDKLKANN